MFHYSNIINNNLKEYLDESEINKKKINKAKPNWKSDALKSPQIKPKQMWKKAKACATVEKLCKTPKETPVHPVTPEPVVQSSKKL